MIKSCTYTGNHARYYGGGVCNRNNSVSTIINCIFYDNTAIITGNEVHNEESDPQIAHCDIAGCGGSTSWVGAEFGTDLGGNIDADPLFINSASDVHLQSGSPCINTGSDAAAPVTDLDGYYRCGTADMGAYEYQFEMKWNGSADANWNNISNWQYIGLTGTPNALPGGGTDITIPITANDPVINNPPVSYAWVGGISIEPGAALILQPGKCLTTEGPIINNGTMLLQSDPSGTASLITNSDVL